jgi:hypothetical protein
LPYSIRRATAARSGQSACVTERVIAVDLGITWDPNVPEAQLTATDNGETWLSLLARDDDADQRPVTLLWRGSVATRMEPPNDEAAEGHRLYDAGLRDVVWVGEVLDSNLVIELERLNRVHPRRDAARYAGLRHWVVPLKECTVEVVARSLEALRGTAR